MDEQRHEHHHHKHRKHRNTKFKKFLKTFRVPLAIGALVLCFLLVLGAALLLEHILSPSNAPDPTDPGHAPGAGVVQEMVYVGMEPISGEISLVGPVVEEYMKSDPSVTISQVKHTVNTNGQRMDVGLDVELDFHIYHLPEKLTISHSQLLVAEDALFQTAVSFQPDSDYHCTLSHLKTGTLYHYRLELTLSNGMVQTLGGTFRTAQSPRILTIDGIRNVRDIGGWKTNSGKAILQGLLYRGTELDGVVEKEYKLNAQGIQEMLTVLNIRTDMDLRTENDRAPGVYILPNVEHTYYDLEQYEGIFAAEEAPQVKRLFSDLSKPEKYPVYLHCTYGMDRTGTAVYLLGALLGMSEEDLVREYELSGLSYSVAREHIQQMRLLLQAYPGNTLQAQTENYLLSVGVTAEEIASIRAIFLGQ